MIDSSPITDYPKVSIIILNWNGWGDTIECLESLYQITYPNYEVILVDNGSEDDSIEKIKEYCEGEIEVESKFFEYSDENKPIKIIEYTREEAEAGGGKEPEIEELSSNRKLIIIKSERNYGFAEGNNIAMRYALKALNPDYVLLLNNDTVVDKRFLGELVKVGEDDEKVGVLNPIIYHYSKPTKIQYSGEKINWYTGMIHRLNKKYIVDIINSDIACGACLLIKNKTIEKIGLLPTIYFMQWEDIDYSINASNNGFKCFYVSHASIWHKHFSSIGEVSCIRIFYSMRNRFIFRRKYFNKLQFFCSTLYFIFIDGPTAFFYFFIRSPNLTIIKFFFAGVKEGLFNCHHDS